MSSKTVFIISTFFLTITTIVFTINLYQWFTFNNYFDNTLKANDIWISPRNAAISNLKFANSYKGFISEFNVKNSFIVLNLNSGPKYLDISNLSNAKIIFRENFEIGGGYLEKKINIDEIDNYADRSKYAKVTLVESILVNKINVLSIELSENEIK